ncbi:hypothetical protein BDN72DRAFT_163639 [Pluteus cervinus]|uniref:Uncharacterized protein n=1 Tax=Pluteus cervinus TaxID=181527 RepID=A0ACD3AJV7_9AGAR|nr:hypothetical protein BDN72DRAFT_163639 [Pluteus cervinus]
MEAHDHVTAINVMSDVPRSGLSPVAGQQCQEEGPLDSQRQHGASSSAREATDINVNVGSPTGTDNLATTANTNTDIATSTNTLELKDGHVKVEMEDIITEEEAGPEFEWDLTFRGEEAEQQAPVLNHIHNQDPCPLLSSPFPKLSLILTAWSSLLAVLTALTSSPSLWHLHLKQLQQSRRLPRPLFLFLHAHHLLANDIYRSPLRRGH